MANEQDPNQSGKQNQPDNNQSGQQKPNHKTGQQSQIPVEENTQGIEDSETARTAHKIAE